MRGFAFWLSIYSAVLVFIQVPQTRAHLPELSHHEDSFEGYRIGKSTLKIRERVCSQEDFLYLTNQEENCSNQAGFRLIYDTFFKLQAYFSHSFQEISWRQI